MVRKALVIFFGILSLGLPIGTALEPLFANILLSTVSVVGGLAALCVLLFLGTLGTTAADWGVVDPIWIPFRQVLNREQRWALIGGTIFAVVVRMLVGKAPANAVLTASWIIWYIVTFRIAIRRAWHWTIRGTEP